MINLSLGGPADPLLSRLAGVAIQRGIVVVCALPPSGRLEGFPAGVPGMLAVRSSDDGPALPGTLAAPGRDILTAQPGGHCGYTSGNSLAAAHVSGAVALLRALSPGLGSEQLRAGLGSTPLDLCAALHQLRSTLACVR